jgi:predicted nucleic acid-binding protein
VQKDKRKMRKTRASDSYVFDTSAILTLWNDEEGADLLESLLRSSVDVYVSFMSYMESRYRIWKNAGKEESDEFSKYLELLPLTKMDMTDSIFEKAIEIKATKSVSVCDSWIIATAIVLDATLVHKDPEFEQVKTLVKLKALPYKPLTREKKKT